MAIIEGPITLVGESGAKPVVKRLVVTDNLATLTTAGYLNTNLNEANALSPSDLLLILYNYDQVTDSGDIDFFTVQINNGIVTLTEDVSTGNVVLPTTANHIATYVNADGKIGEDAATAINAGNIQAGESGTEGKFVAYPATASKGTLVVSASDNAGAYDVTLTNDSMGQTSTLYMTDPASSDGYIQVSATPSDPCANLFWIDVSITAVEISGASSKVIKLSSGTKQYAIREMYLVSGGVDWTGGGSSDVEVTDGTNQYTRIQQITLEAMSSAANARWGDGSIPYPAVVPINTPTVAGQSIVVKYVSAGAEYTGGELKLSLLLERVA